MVLAFRAENPRKAPYYDKYCRKFLNQNGKALSNRVIFFRNFDFPWNFRPKCEKKAMQCPIKETPDNIVKSNVYGGMKIKAKNWAYGLLIGKGAIQET